MFSYKINAKPNDTVVYFDLIEVRAGGIKVSLTAGSIAGSTQLLAVDDEGKVWTGSGLQVYMGRFDVHGVFQFSKNL